MSYPTPPEISTSYTAQEQALGNGTLPGQELDVDFAAVRASVTSAIEFLKGITRSDGALANGVVTQESLAASLVIGFDTPEIWAGGTAYTTSSLVFEGARLYICLAAHTSTVFATDLSSGRWGLLADLTPPGGALIAANNLSDVADTANARANLGLGSMATASAAAYRTNVEQDLVFQPILTGLTASVAELNLLDGVVASTAELNHVDGVTSPIQTQLNAKQAEVLTTNGDLVVRAAGVTTRLPVGSAGQVLTVSGGAPTWIVPDGPTALVNWNGIPVSGTYSRTGNLVTVTLASHGMSTGHFVSLDFTSGTATDGYYQVTVVDANTFTAVDTSSGATSGNVTRNVHARSARNVSNVQRTGLGEYTITFTTPFPDDSYTAIGMTRGTTNHPTCAMAISEFTVPTASQLVVSTGATGGSGAVGLRFDLSRNNLAVFA